MLTRAKTVNTKETIDENTRETVMAAKPQASIDDLLKEFQKNQKGNKAIQDQLNNIQTTVTANTSSINAHIKTYDDEMREMSGKVKTLQETVNNFEQAMNLMSDDLKELKDENLQLRQRIYESENVNQRFVGIEEEGKRRNIIIDGINEAPFHKTKEAVTELCSTLGVELTLLTVVNMFRLGAQRADATQPRPVKVKFQSNLTKQILYKNISTLKEDEKWSRISTRDDVTEEVQDIQRDLRCIAASARSQGLKAQVRGKALILEDKRYTYDEINDLPNNLSLENAKIVKTIDGVAFQGKHAYLSNLATCQIQEGTDSFSSAEQYILVNKARLAEDQLSERKLRESKNVFDMIKIGKRIKTTEAWKKDEVRIVAKAAVLKFSQNPMLLDKLKKTDGHLYEATKSKIWGRGFTIAQAARIKHGDNPGENTFGLILELISDKALKGEDLADSLKELNILKIQLHLLGKRQYQKVWTNYKQGCYSLEILGVNYYVTTYAKG